MNYNKFLQNTTRSSVIGRNIFTYGGYNGKFNWSKPQFGLNGQLVIGHPTPLKDVVSFRVLRNGRPLSFECVRNQWTPAYMKTHYRCTPDGQAYTAAGTVVVRETKCFNENDIFVSSVTVINDDREQQELTIELITDVPTDGKLTETLIGAVGRSFDIKGFIVTMNSFSEDSVFHVTIPGQSAFNFSYASALSLQSAVAAQEAAQTALKDPDPFTSSEVAFNHFIEHNAPMLECDNQDILKVYYYRWFLIYRALHRPSDVIAGHPLRSWCFYESTKGSWYNCPVGLPVPLHIEETKWMRDPVYVLADAANWAKGHEAYTGYIQYTPMAIWHLYTHVQDKQFLESVYNACLDYTKVQFSPEQEGIAFFPKQVGSWETGAEYQPAFYQFTNPKWDWQYDVEGERKLGITEKASLYRLDRICYAIGNLIGCMHMAEVLGKKEDSMLLLDWIARSRELLLKYFWDEERGIFLSVDPVSGRHCNESVCYDSFFPFLWGIMKEPGSTWSILKNELESEFSSTTVEKSNPMYWFNNAIAGPTYSSQERPHDYQCCWNGPVWPYATCTVAEALGGATNRDSNLISQWLEYFAQYTELHFLGGDRSLPLITENYRPTDGVSFNAISDYFHSTWLDLFYKYWAGICVADDGSVTVNPFTNIQFKLKGVCVNGNEYEIVYDGSLASIHKF